MEKYIRNFEKEGKFLKLYIRIPRRVPLLTIMKYFERKYNDEYMSFAGQSLDITGKFLILTFRLRSEDDIKPYVEKYTE